MIETVKKKSVKWQCKLCNIKQSIKHIYRKSFSAKECRVQVQKLNGKRRDISDFECDKNFAQQPEKQHDLYHHSFGNNKVPPKEHSNFYDNLHDNEIPNIMWNKSTVKIMTSSNINTSQQPWETCCGRQNYTKDNNKQKLISSKWSKYLVVDKDDSD